MFPAAIVMPDPTAPIDFVEEPVHDDQQHDDSKESGRGLKIERAHVVAQRIDNSHGNDPGDQRGDEGEARAHSDGFPVRPFWSRHRGGDRRQNQNALESFAKNKNSDIERGDCFARVRPRWIRRAFGENSLPDQDRNDGQRRDGNTDTENYLPRPIGLA